MGLLEAMNKRFVAFFFSPEKKIENLMSPSTRKAVEKALAEQSRRSLMLLDILLRSCWDHRKKELEKPK